LAVTGPTRTSLGFAVLVVAVVLTACGGSDDGAGRLSLVAYSTLKEAYGVGSAFQHYGV
jgi:hypothetical protein